MASSKLPRIMFFCLFRTPSLNTTLQRPELRGAGVCVWQDSGQSLKQLLGAYRWLSHQPLFDN
ncbi:hypothetical protein ACFS07_10695 [Undibacterium arcticum]